MNKKHLEQTLEELHKNLEDSESLEDHTVELLNSVKKDIEMLLGEEEVEQHEGSIRDRLDKAVLQLDESYPELTNNIRQVIQVLSNMGI